MEQLNDDNFLIMAMHAYDAPTCSDIKEFQNEIKRFGYINRSFKLDTVNTQLVLNHIIILYNVFGYATTKMLLFKVERDMWSYLIPFLLYLDRLTIEEIGEVANEIIVNEKILKELRNL